MASCPHIEQIARLPLPRLADAVHREECTQCFDNQDGPDGVDVCLSCFNGGCVGNEDRHHARTHYERTQHPFSLNIRRTPKKAEREDQPPPAKMTKLAIVAEREDDKYEWTCVVRCWACEAKLLPELGDDPRVKRLVDGVMHSMSSARQSEVKAWEEEINPCEHTLLLLPDNTRGAIDAAGLAHCASCDLRENLWLCLTCGSLSCGRQQFGGVSGNGHALSHYEQTRHPVAVKLGTITAEGSADMYCYACNDATLDPELAAHLASFGINVQTQKKTEKSMTELQLEQNFMFEFSMTDESGNAFVPVFGPGLTGLQNLGNSCYMASVIQGLFSLPQFAGRYYDPDLAAAHFLTCRESLPAACLECQMYKLGDGLLSGRYSVPRPALKDGNSPHAYSPGAPADDVDATTASPVVFQEGVKPTSFKALVGKGHAEFSTMKQQDAEEFLSHLLKALRTYARKVGVDEKAEPTEVFKFGMEQRLQCLNCKRVRYKVDESDVLSVPVPAHRKMDVDTAPVEGKDGKEEKKPEYEDVALTECIDIVVENEVLSYRCPGCNADVTATKSSRFATFPEVLVVHAKKFQLVGWVPTKLDIPVILHGDGELVLDKYKGTGLQPGEEELPEAAAVAAALPAFNAEAMAQLEGMGFPTIRCQKALLATGNSSADAAMEWLFGHMDDPDIDAPLDLGGGSGGAGGAAEPSAESIAMLADMGFTSAQARKALKETGGNAERAVEWLFNHPDDAGEDASAAPSSSAAPAAPPVGGSATLPAKYRLKAFISHKGPSVHSGHYVAHIRTEEGWMLFNDEKVVKADNDSVNALRKLAYLYIFERI